MLTRRTLFERDGLSLGDVACRHAAGPGREEPSHGHALVFVRRGCFVRRAGGRAELLDPTVAYCMNPGEEQCYDHPAGDGDDCTTIGFDPAAVVSLWGGELRLPSGPLPVPPHLDLAHRRLLAAARREGEADSLYEDALGLAAGALEQRDPARVAAARPPTQRARRRLVADAREALATDPGRSLADLARELATSPHHLSRVFHAHTGHTVSRYRLLLRTRTALERLAEGERNLGRLAAEVGFADQAHLCRVIRGQTGHTPSALRSALA